MIAHAGVQGDVQEDYNVYSTCTSNGPVGGGTGYYPVQYSTWCGGGIVAVSIDRHDVKVIPDNSENKQKNDHS